MKLLKIIIGIQNNSQINSFTLLIFAVQNPSACSNEIRRLVIHASTELNQGNTFIAAFFKISIRTVERILNKFNLTKDTDKLPRGGNKSTESSTCNSN